LARATQTIREASPLTNCAAPLLVRQLTEYVVSRWYRSPELILNGRAEASTDMWSIGCIFAELLLRKPLFNGESSMGVLLLILKLMGTPEPDDCGWSNRTNFLYKVAKFPSTFQQKFKDVDPSARHLLEKLFELDPTKRITAAQALQHPFLNSYFDTQSVVPFPLKPRSDVDKSSLDDYYQFETKLDSRQYKSSAEMTQEACALVLKEIARYSPAPSVAPAASSSSLFSGSSFFSVKPNAQAALSTPHINEAAETTVTVFNGVIK